MKHSDLKVGMKVKRVTVFNSSYYASTIGNISTVESIEDDSFTIVEGMAGHRDGWEAQFFEPVEESSFVEGGYTKDFGNTKIAAHVISNKDEIKEETQTQKITMDKKYRTRCGYPVRVICVDKKDSPYPVLALVNENPKEILVSYTDTGFQLGSGSSTPYDLIEVSPWEDFKKDDKVMVRNYEYEDWFKRYFAYEKDGKAYVYQDGCTSWSSYYDAITWKYCRKPTQEELES